MLMALLLPISGWAAPGSPLEITDFGEGVFGTDPEFDFSDQATAAKQLLATLEDSPDMAKHLRAIREYYHKRVGTGNEVVSRLRDLVVSLRASKRERATVEMAFVIGLLIQEDTKEARVQYLKDLAPMVTAIRRGLPSDPWARLVAAMLYGSLPELQGNWFDEALYALSLGYDEAQLQLAVGSFLLVMDLSYGGNERLQWFIYLAMTRAIALTPSDTGLNVRIRKIVNANLNIPGYRPSRWLKALVGS